MGGKRFRVYNRSKKIDELNLHKFAVVDTWSDLGDNTRLVALNSCSKRVADFCAAALNAVEKFTAHNSSTTPASKQASAD